MNRLALFDCDGTLVDSAANICTAMAVAFAEHGLAAPAAVATRRIVGLSLPQAMALLHPHGSADDHHALTGHYKRAFHGLRGQGLIAEPLFAGMIEAIETLHARGWLLGVATGKSDRGLNLCLEHHGLHPRFVTLQTADRHPSKPDPAMALAAMAEAGAAPETTIVIGDTAYDIGMARAAGARSIGVAWGYHDRAELLAEGADAVVDDPCELPDLMETLLA